MSSNVSAPAPDYSGIARAQESMAKESLAFSREQFDWAKKTYAENKGVTDRVVELFLDAQERNAETAQKDRARYEEIYQPLETSLAKEAADYNSQERRDAEMGRAAAGVGQQFEAARTNAQRQLESFGINPSATRFAALDVGLRAQEAATKAAAATQAGERTDAIARQLRSEAINVGRGYPGQIAGQYGTSLNAGNAGVGNMLNQTASGASTMGTGMQWNQQAANSYAGAAQTRHNEFTDQMASWKANQEASSGWGTALGLGASLAMAPINPTSLLGRSPMFAAEGGEVPEELSPTRGKAIDDVPARLSVGEFIVPKDTVEWLGQKHFYGLIEKTQKERDEAQQRTQAVPAIHPGAMRKDTPEGRRAALRMS